jgi:hypothetical protein
MRLFCCRQWAWQCTSGCAATTTSLCALPATSLGGWGRPSCLLLPLLLLRGLRRLLRRTRRERKRELGLPQLLLLCLLL